MADPSAQGRRLVPIWVAHEEKSSARTTVAAWRIYHNAQTDKDASIMANPLLPGVRECLENLISENDVQQTLREAVSAYLHGTWAKHAEAEESTGCNGLV